jgi:hypothetical protein
VFADPGTRTTGTGAGDFAIVGPSWHGELPPGVEKLQSSTNLVWIIGRTYCTGTPEDYAAVHAIQDDYKVVPLSAWGKPHTPPLGKVGPSIDMKTAVREQVDRMDATSFLTLLATLMKQNPPIAADAPALARFNRIGLSPGQGFDPSKIANVPGIQDVPKLAVEQIAAHSIWRRGPEWLGVFQASWPLWHRLRPARVDRARRARLQSARRRRLSHNADRCRWPRTRRREQVCHSVPQGADTAGEGFLVADDVQRAILLRGQSAEPLHAECAQYIEGRSRWHNRASHTGEQSGPNKEANCLAAHAGLGLSAGRTNSPQRLSMGAAEAGLGANQTGGGRGLGTAW